ncbi:hypothetical protein [Pseudoxanthomonas sp.]|uniref:hypothetical protein n=1 Tax=Pseudoxanthomonas sp. TaxID=1871049 RepID=UPI00262B6422|nr:hypothetical protein [Pseudoxanthomonas sp.]WDS34652.1 MAG: hypothetical protein O8I58_09595 [Pseudoxanthomonas sp.]
MKPWIWTILLLLGAQTAYADTAISETLVCRDNDPFVLCTQGCKDDDYNWKPKNSMQGTYTPVMPYCPWPSTGECCIGYVCFEPWTQTAFTAYFQYARICRKAHKEGKWVGEGKPEETPYDH